jgi:hypothetical protein
MGQKTESGPSLGRAHAGHPGWHLQYRARGNSSTGIPEVRPPRVELPFPAQQAGGQPEVMRSGEALEYVPTGLIVVRCELGAGYSLFIRGEGAGLRWNEGQRLKFIEPGLWVWFTEGSSEPVKFQLLLNDSVWARGEAAVLNPGEHLEITPDFEWPEIPLAA